ncbi:MAG TPA: cytochrome c [Methylomirabilota bacterium]
MMKYVFVLVLLLVGGVAGVQGLAIVYRWTHDMIQTQVVRPGKMNFAMAPGSLPRTGGQLYYSKEQREAAALRKNPVPATADSIRKGGNLYVVYCTPCHGASGKGNGPVVAKYVPTPDLSNPDLQKGRTDGYWQSYLSVGGAVMPSYGESLSAEERWDVVNYLRTLASK